MFEFKIQLLAINKAGRFLVNHKIKLTVKVYLVIIRRMNVSGFAVQVLNTTEI